jgi:hypothetical protein
MKFISKRRVIIFSVVIGIFVLLGILLNNSEKPINNEGELTLDQAPVYNDLKLGLSTKDEVINKLGEPLNTQLKVNQELLEYESNNPNFNNEVYLQDNKIYFIKEFVTLEDDKKIPSIKNVYGNPDKVLYGPGSGVGFYLYVYPEDGIAYVGHDKSGILLEIWYFTPVTYEEFKFNYAKDYSETRPIIQ